MNIDTFEPFQKNPAISKTFREMGLADELGSGMRNTYKFTKLYSGGEPVFTEDGDVFKIVIPLSPAATVSAGPEDDQSEKHYVTLDGVTIKLTIDKINDLLLFAEEPRTRTELREHCKLSSPDYFRVNILKPMLELGLLELTIPDKPSSPKQKYHSSRTMLQSSAT